MHGGRLQLNVVYECCSEPLLYATGVPVSVAVFQINAAKQNFDLSFIPYEGSGRFPCPDPGQFMATRDAITGNSRQARL